MTVPLGFTPCALMILTTKSTLREKCLYSEFFWSVFSRIRTEYGDLRIHSECRKIRTIKALNTGTFYEVPLPNDMQKQYLCNKSTRVFSTQSRTYDKFFVISVDGKIVLYFRKKKFIISAWQGSKYASDIRLLSASGWARDSQYSVHIRENAEQETPYSITIFMVQK